MTGTYNANRILCQLTPSTIDTLIRLVHERQLGALLGLAVAPNRFSDPNRTYAVRYPAGTARCAWKPRGIVCHGDATLPRWKTWIKHGCASFGMLFREEP